MSSKIFKDPKILYNKESDLALFFSAKCACSFGVKWFFYQIGLLEECENYHRWPHKYRKEIFNDTKNDFDNYLRYESKLVLLVRNPFRRVVSSYLHAIKNGYENNNLSKFLSRNIDATNGYSFYEFISYLKTIDLNKCDVHQKMQSNYFTLTSDFKNFQIVRVENLFEDFQKVEKLWNLKIAPLRQISDSLNSNKVNYGEYNRFCFDEPYKGDDLKDHLFPIPDVNWFYNQELIEDVYGLYKEDFETFQYVKKI